MKKTIPVYAKVLIGITVGLLIFCLIGWLFFSAKISSWTNGRIFGPGVESISVKELESGEIRAVSQKERKHYQRYAKNRHKQAMGELSKEQKELYKFYTVLPELMQDILNGTVDLEEEEVSRHMEKLMASASLDLKTKDSVNRSLFLMTAYADETSDSVASDMNILHNLAEALYLARDYKMSTALAALAAVNLPNHAPTANLLGNLLKQNGDLEESLKMYEYAVRCAPDQEAALIGAGNACLDLGRYDEAAGFFQRALSVSGGGGPANQGMMLVSIARGDEGSAFLYMIEGAKEGYTSVLTDAYVYFRNRYPNREKYLDFCGPILDQYGFRYLTDFTRTRLAFDPTLDTPGQQLKLDRTMVLPKDGKDVVSGAVISLYDGSWRNMSGYLNQVCGPGALANFMNTGDISALMSSETYHYLTLENGYNLMGSVNAAGELLTTLKDGDLNAMEKIMGTWDSVMEAKDLLGYHAAASVAVNGDNYEQEVFWIRILTDYTEYKFLQIADQYCDSLADQYVWDTLDESYGRLEQRIAAMEADGGSLAGIMRMLTYFMTNGSFVADRKYTLDEVATVGQELCGFSPYLKKGYMECVMLAEEYWLYTNNILGMIADDGIYNRMRAYRDYTAVRVATYFPMMAGTYFGSVGITCEGWGGITFDWWFDTGTYTEIHSALHEVIGPTDVKYPQFPELPVSGMGKEPKPPIIITVPVPKPKVLGTAITGVLKEDLPAALNIKIQADDDSMVQTEEHSAAQTDIQHKTEFSTESTLAIGFEFKVLGQGVEFSFNPDTLEFTLGVKAFVMGAQLGYNPTTSDLTVYAQVGGDGSTTLLDYDKFHVGIGTLISGKAVAFLKGTINTETITSSSVESGVAVEGAFGSSGLGSQLSYDLLSGVTKDTAHLLVGGQKVTMESEGKTGEGLLELLDFRKWFQ